VFRGMERVRNTSERSTSRRRRRKKSRKKWDGEIDRWNNLYTRSNNFRKRWIMHPNGCARALTPRTTHLHFDIVVDDAFFFFFWILFYLFSFFFLPSHQ
jgi:hypothetical protein